MTIPSAIDGKTVTAIGDYAFYECMSLSSVTIPDGVTAIGDYAFYACKSLSSVTISDSVTTIGELAFSNCERLTSITIPNSVKSIEDGAFSGCTSLTSIIIPDSVTTIGSYAETYAKRLNIPFVAPLQNTSTLNKTTVPKLTVVTVTGASEYGTGNVTYAFYYKKSTSNNWISIGKKFEDTTEVTFTPNTVGTYLVMVKAKDEAGNIVTKILELTVTDPVYYEYSIFIDNTVMIDKYTGVGGDVIIPSVIDGLPVTIIGDSAFSDRTDIISVTIPNSVTEILTNAFSDCTGLISVNIPDGVTQIRDRTFYGCTGLTSVIIPESVTTIGWEAFSCCTSLTSVTIPASVTTIGAHVFDGCKSLSSVTIPTSVATIGDWAFSYCTSLTSITIPGSVTSIGEDAFYGCSDLTIYGNSGSYAETYAKRYNIRFVAPPSKHLHPQQNHRSETDGSHRKRRFSERYGQRHLRILLQEIHHQNMDVYGREIR